MGDGVFAALADDGELDLLAAVTVDGLEPLVGGGHDLTVHLGDDITGAEAGNGGGTVVVHAFDEKALSVMHAEVVGELGAEHVELEAGVEGVVADSGDEAVAVKRRSSLVGEFIGIGDGDVLRPGVGFDGGAVGELDLEGDELAVAAEQEGDGAAGGKLAKHAAELSLAVDWLIVQ